MSLQFPVQETLSIPWKKHSRWTSHKDFLRIPPVAIVRPQAQSKGILVALLWNGRQKGLL